MSVRSVQMTNAEFARAFPAGTASFLFRDGITGIEWRTSYVGLRTDHYDSTPMTPQDSANFLRAINNRQNWIAIWGYAQLPNGTWVDFGIVPRMHGGIIGSARPGAPFQNHSNVRPASGWKENGGHYCGYLINSVGGTTNATSLPASNNSRVSAEANRRAVQLVARGAMSRAAAHEANLRSLKPEAPMISYPNVTVNYQVKVAGSSVNIRTGPGTNHGIVRPVTRGTRFDIDREQTGPDAQAGNPNARWLRIRGGEFNNMWIVERFTARLITSELPAAPQPKPGTWSVQVMAARDHTYVDEMIARFRGMGYPNAYRYDGNGWYRVRIPGGTEAQARALLPELRERGYGDAFPVRNG